MTSIQNNKFLNPKIINQKFKNQKLKNNSGFTMIELLVAMAIVSILSVLTLTNIREGSNDQALLRSAQNFASNIKKAQNFALSPKKYGANPVCFYGIKINTATDYFLYYNDRNNCVGQVRYNNNFSTKLKTIKLENGIIFTNIVNQDIAFLPPEPMTYFFGNQNFIDKNIILQISGGLKTKTITINKFGNVEVQ